MRNRSYLIGFGLTVGIIVLVSVTSRMALRGSLVDDAGTPGASSPSEPAPELPPLGEPLSNEALTQLSYSVADGSVRYALSAAGRTFVLSFDAEGESIPVTTSALRPTGIQSAALQLDRATAADVDGDRYPDSVLPVVIRIGGKTFTDLAIVHNNGDGTGTYSAGYPLGMGSEVQSIEIVRGKGMLVKFRYTPPHTDNAVDAQLLVPIAEPEPARQSSSSEASDA
ncbi:MAG TPA: hypothetical protein PKV72_06465 [Candidatus Peribacteria bacterium]|nr:hypothetical protein [Candidatus Peribacteria bacterium]